MGERDVFAVAPPGLWCWVGSDSHGSRRGLIAAATPWLVEPTVDAANLAPLSPSQGRGAGGEGFCLMPNQPENRSRKRSPEAIEFARLQ